MNVFTWYLLHIMLPVYILVEFMLSIYTLAEYWLYLDSVKDHKGNVFKFPIYEYKKFTKKLNTVGKALAFIWMIVAYFPGYLLSVFWIFMVWLVEFIRKLLMKK